jgi:multiple antibiotic resistance protein
MRLILTLTLYLLALINPLSKVFFLATSFGEANAKEIQKISIQSSVIALIILLSFGFAGNFILHQIFHAELYAFRTVGGLVLIASGFKALTKGVFFEAAHSHQMMEMSIVPLASPLIAGPATITGVVSFAAENGFPATAVSAAIAVSVNLLFMLLSKPINSLFKHFNLTGALVRVTGLIVAVMAMQMIFNGIGEWISKVVPKG